ncbi:unnamed protein product [Allacma fusca]|uniref:Splicing factor YJU2 n=1 Tax=Allacma fusca TaxID=39272 RepID=A0A8J2NST2_9HEXA|nr:unnamed protein product [Allacma fusca]
MSERKVLNKYYPPDFDPSKIPRVRQSKNRQFTVRLMAPCNMRCNTCGEYIYKGKKFNARKEDVENETYLGIRIYRFYIKCTRCLAEISFKTDPQSTDYIIENGATRNFMALKLAEEQAMREEAAEREEEATNPMKLLEKRTQASRHEMAVLEALEEVKELNQRHVRPDFETMLEKYDELRQLDAQQQEDDDEAFIKAAFAEETGFIKRIEDESDSSDEEASKPKKSFVIPPNPTDILTVESKPLQNSGTKPKNEEKSIGLMKINKNSLVKRKVPNAAQPSTPEPIIVKAPPKPTALSLLGGYDSSGSGSE